MNLSKKIAMPILVIVLLLTLVVCDNTPAYAAVEKPYNALSDFSYTIAGGKITITGYTGAANQVMIAPTYEVAGKQYIVSAIDAAAFEAQKEITYAELPDTLEVVGEYAFYDCLALKTVVVRGKQTQIETGALGFYYISRREDGLVEGFVLEGRPDSLAESYANENGIIFTALATDAVTNGNRGFSTLAEAVTAAEAGSVLQLNRDITETTTVFKNIMLDLNGHSVNGTVTVAQGYALEIKDSTTDDFTATTYGRIKTAGNTRAAEGYMAITEENGISYHRLDLQICSINLRPVGVGLYYGSNFGGDEAVKAMVECYGTALSLTGAPTAQEIKSDKYYSKHTAFSGDSWVCGETGKAYGTLLKGIWKQANRLSRNTENAELKIYGVSYVQLMDGTILLGKPESMSLRDVVEKIDDDWKNLDSQQIAAMQELYEEYGNIMEAWDIPNLKKNVNYQVTFVDFDDAVISVQLVGYGCNAEKPNDPVRENYVFLSWDKEFTNIDRDITVKAQYIRTYNVTFVDCDGKILKQEQVVKDGKATGYQFAETELPPEGYNRTGWDRTFDNITEDITVRATYEKKVYTVKFYMPDRSTLIDTKQVEYGAYVEAPEYEEHYFDWNTYQMRSFSGWSIDLKEEPIQGDVSIYAKYEKPYDKPVISIETTRNGASVKLYAPKGCYLYGIDFGFNWSGQIAISNFKRNSASILYKGKDGGFNLDYNNKYNRFHYTWTDAAGVEIKSAEGLADIYAEVVDITFEISGGSSVNKDALKLFSDCTIIYGSTQKANVDKLKTVTPIIVIK